MNDLRPRATTSPRREDGRSAYLPQSLMPPLVIHRIFFACDTPSSRNPATIPGTVLCFRGRGMQNLEISPPFQCSLSPPFQDSIHFQHMDVSSGSHHRLRAMVISPMASVPFIRSCILSHTSHRFENRCNSLARPPHL